MTSIALRAAAVLAAGALTVAACGGGGGGEGGDGGDGPGGTGGGLGGAGGAAEAAEPAGGSGAGSPDSSPARQERFDPSVGVVVLSEFAGVLHERFELDEDEITVFDPAAGDEVEYGSAARQERYELARDQGFLGLFSGVFESPDGGELWELTTEVFRWERGASVVFERYGAQGGGGVANSERLESERHPLGGDRSGVVIVERYVHRARAEGAVHETGEFLELRGAMVDGNVLHHVLGVVDVDAPESADPLAAARRSLLAVEGAHERARGDAGGEG